MGNNTVKNLERFASMFLDGSLENEGFEITEEVLIKAVNGFVEAVKLMGDVVTESDIESAIRNLETRYAITMDIGLLLKEDNYKKWYHASKVERGTQYWDRFRRYLEEDVALPKMIIDRIDEATEEIMDVLGDPKSESNFQRKGLVIGSVQSGKTSNYIALMNKAVDSGYKVIILLTGTIEKLRQQTQSRVDEGFVGVDSKALRESKKSEIVGVGRYDRNIQVVSFTTTATDFKTNNENVPLRSVNDPVVFVIKKNKSVMEKLRDWLTLKNAESNGKINVPLLLIDDESDNASVNTNSTDEDPTTINNLIRELLRLFARYSYVGFTATPFANIFIDPELDQDAKEDLFPKDFIYLLEQPSNYIGPNEMYKEDGKYHYMIRYNDDMDFVLPLGHKNGAVPSSLPRSLEDAILTFMLGNAIRDLRGSEKKHRSMLIHVSRFISVQKAVHDKVDSFVRDVKAQIKNYILSDEQNNFVDRLKNLFMEEFKHGTDIYDIKVINEEWEDLKKVLYDSVTPIQIRTINSASATKNLNYDEYPDGLRLIAVGGLSLARGLTLEGLMISYFYRNTKMYDTLMQMGRWFGYRDGYDDICRLWTSKESADWYEHIAEATEELRLEIKKMSYQNRKPSEFGLRVRSSADTPLIITARNKMKNTETVKLRRSLNGRVIETAILPSQKKDREYNNEVIEKWLINNKSFLEVENDNLGVKKPTLKNVPKKNVMQLLESVIYPYLNEFSNDSQFLTEIKNHDSKTLERWDIVVATNEESENRIKNKAVFGGITIYPVERQFDFFGSNNYIRVSRSKKRLGSTNYALTGLEKYKYEQIKEEVEKLLHGKVSKKGNKKAPTENMYFNTGIERNPLIIIYPVQLKGNNESNQAEKSYLLSLDSLVTGIAIGIPDIKGVANIEYDYKINKVYQRELIEGTANQDAWDMEYDEYDEEGLSGE